MSDVNSEVDLFGDAVQRAEKGRGRPAHARSRETVNRVILGLARGWSLGDVAKSIGIDLKTLRKHYFPELGRRAAMGLMMESVQLGRLNDQAAGGNVAAEKELMKALAKGRVEAMSEHVTKRGRAESKEPALGKKDSAKAAAKHLKGRFSTRSAPPALLN